MALVLRQLPSAEPEPAARDSLTQQAYSQIRAALMSSHYLPGQRLVLRQLATGMGISPTPVREALLRLVAEHALTLDVRGVACVPALDAPRSVEIRDLRIELEGRAGAAATARITAADVAGLDALNRRIREAEQQLDAKAALEANERFHMRLYGLAQNPVLLTLIEGLWVRCAPFFLGILDRGPERDGTRHELILRGLHARDPDVVRQGIAEDIFAGWRSMTPGLAAAAPGDTADAVSQT
jgi:DNA-binding GntR family transcriptional regulator